MVARFSIIRQVVAMERKLTDTKLKHFGCIYFKEDVPHGDHLTVVSTESLSTLERFRMGPLVTIDYWEKKNAGMDLNRGPCKQTYLMQNAFI